MNEIKSRFEIKTKKDFCSILGTNEVIDASSNCTM